MGLVVFMYMICSLRINVVFFLIFLFLDIALFLLTGAYYKASHGDMATYKHLTVVSSVSICRRQPIRI
jgi:succinate-acetate transporter protein